MQTDKAWQKVESELVRGLDYMQKNSGGKDTVELEFRLGTIAVRNNRTQFQPNLKKKLVNKIFFLLDSDLAHWDKKWAEEYSDYRNNKTRTRRTKDSTTTTYKKKLRTTTFNFVKPHLDLRMSVAKEISVNDPQLPKNAKFANKKRHYYQKDFVQISITESGGKHKRYMVELEILPDIVKRFPREYVVKATVEYLKLLMEFIA